MTDDEPTHDDLVEQAETVLEATRASMYDVADGEAYRLREQLSAALDDDQGDSTARIDDHKDTTCPACGHSPDPVAQREDESNGAFAERLRDAAGDAGHRTTTTHTRGETPRATLRCGGCGEVLASTDADVVGLLEEPGGDPE